MKTAILLEPLVQGDYYIHPHQCFFSHAEMAQQRKMKLFDLFRKSKRPNYNTTSLYQLPTSMRVGGKIFIFLGVPPPFLFADESIVHRSLRENPLYVIDKTIRPKFRDVSICGSLQDSCSLFLKRAWNIIKHRPGKKETIVLWWSTNTNWFFAKHENQSLKARPSPVGGDGVLMSARRSANLGWSLSPSSWKMTASAVVTTQPRRDKRANASTRSSWERDVVASATTCTATPRDNSCSAVCSTHTCASTPNRTTLCSPTV